MPCPAGLRSGYRATGDMRCSCRLFRRHSREIAWFILRQSVRGQRPTGSTGAGTVAAILVGSGSSGERLSVSGAGSPQQSGSPPTSQLTLSAQRFRGKRTGVGRPWASDASQKQRGARSQSAQQQQIHTHTHTRTLSIPRLSFQPRPSLCLSVPPALTTPSFSFSLPLRAARPRTASSPLRRPSNLGCFRA
jgi:hypothetical protein